MHRYLVTISVFQAEQQQQQQINTIINDREHLVVWWANNLCHKQIIEEKNALDDNDITII